MTPPLESAAEQPRLYWLIEEGSPARYVETEHYGAVDWTDEAHKALKFPDEAMAREFVAHTILRVYEVRVCEHMFGCEATPEPRDG